MDVMFPNAKEEVSPICVFRKKKKHTAICPMQIRAKTHVVRVISLQVKWFYTV